MTTAAAAAFLVVVTEMSIQVYQAVCIGRRFRYLQSIDSELCTISAALWNFKSGVLRAPP